MDTTPNEKFPIPRDELKVKLKKFSTEMLQTLDESKLKGTITVGY
jgi:hypothetical protein